MPLQLWTVTALNLPEHARNPIHTDAGAQAAGFPRALVAGVTTYAYLTHPAVVGWGDDWLAGGGGEVRFRSPVFEHDTVRCTPRADGADGADPDDVAIDALCDDGPARAIFAARRRTGPASGTRPGEVLKPLSIRLEGELGDEYGSRAGDDLAVYAERGIVHPAVWPALANHIVHTQVARGSWIHTRSDIRHHAIAPVGALAQVHATVVDRFQRSGERAVLDVRIEIDGVVVATIEHEAIVALPGLNMV